ncbi:hypothetical protein VC83_07433 [Pseudogymnoascus destructans]|uniref:Uncharacterized protein n=1 Tax=Pseudogymnoascus destructans TaxID=655981 RepID=A0A177A4T9_9PEZI|nr:uncharacterized protein VC83_07433 [Pseudogymnoascus destructans]OAF56123.1 hypothetical protein VC83_07433 [Pseudogymnoascus destructans]
MPGRGSVSHLRFAHGVKQINAFHHYKINTNISIHPNTSRNMASSFSSERLIYRGLEGTPRDKAFILSILSDRTSSENTTNYLVKPASSADVDSFMRGFREAFLGVLVCTPNPSVL